MFISLPVSEAVIITLIIKKNNLKIVNYIKRMITKPVKNSINIVKLKLGF